MDHTETDLDKSNDGGAESSDVKAIANTENGLMQ